MLCRAGCGHEATHYIDFPQTGVYWYCEQHAVEALASIAIRPKGAPSSFNAPPDADRPTP